MASKNGNDKSTFNILSGFLSRASNWLGWGKGRNKEKDSDINRSETPELLKNYIIEEDEDDIELVKSDVRLRELILTHGLRLHNAGRTDGTIYQDSRDIEKMTAAEAEIIAGTVQAYYKGKVSSITPEILDLEKSIEELENDYKETSTYKREVEHFFRVNPRAFSINLSIFYTLIALFLVLADIPLALKLTQRGFDLDLGSIPLKELFITPWGVFQQNWEVFLLALGISVCTIFVKIFWDTFIEKPTIATTLYAEQYGRAFPKEKRKYYLVVLALFVMTILSLGLFRDANLNDRNIAEATANEGEVNSSFVPDTTGTSRQNPINADSSIDYKKVVTLTTFVLITLLFPIVSGICFSIGINCLHNHNELTRSKTEWEHKGERFRDELTKKSIKEEQKANYSSWLERYKDPKYITTISNLLLAYYNHGYQKGALESVSQGDDTDIYHKAGILRSKVVNNRISSILQNNNSVDSNEAHQYAN